MIAGIRCRGAAVTAAALLGYALSGCGSNAQREPTGGNTGLDEAWTSMRAMPDQRTEVGVAAVGERIYVLGGFARTGGAVVAPRALLGYDVARDAWSVIDSVPQGVNHAGLAALDGRLYLIGGFAESTFTPTASVRIYDPEHRTWSEGAPLPTPRGALAVGVLEGKIHAIGGNVADPRALSHEDHRPGSDNSSVGTHEVYDPRTNTWSRRAPMQVARNHHGAAVVGGKIYVLGGRVGGEMTMTAHEVYDPAANAWSNVSALPTGRSGIAVLAHDERVYVFGGEMSDRTFDETERYDPRTNRWEALARMPTGRHGLGAASVGAFIYVISGGPQPGFAFSGVNERLTP